MIDLRKAFMEPFKAQDSWKKIGIFYGINIGFYVLLIIAMFLWFIALAASGVDVHSILAKCEGGCPVSYGDNVMDVMLGFLPLILFGVVFVAYISGYFLDFVKNVINKEDSPLPSFMGNTKHFMTRGFKNIALITGWLMIMCSPFALMFLYGLVFVPMELSPAISIIVMALFLISFIALFITVLPAMVYSQTLLAYGINFKRCFDIKLIWNLFKHTWQSYLAVLGIIIAYNIVIHLSSLVGIDFIFGVLGLVIVFVFQSFYAHIFIEALEKSEGEIV